MENIPVESGLSNAMFLCLPTFSGENTAVFYSHNTCCTENATKVLQWSLNNACGMSKPYFLIHFEKLLMWFTVYCDNNNLGFSLMFGSIYTVNYISAWWTDRKAWWSGARCTITSIGIYRSRMRNSKKWNQDFLSDWDVKEHRLGNTVKQTF